MQLNGTFKRLRYDRIKMLLEAAINLSCVKEVMFVPLSRLLKFEETGKFVCVLVSSAHVDRDLLKCLIRMRVFVCCLS